MTIYLIAVIAILFAFWSNNDWYERCRKCNDGWYENCLKLNEKYKATVAKLENRIDELEERMKQEDKS